MRKRSPIWSITKDDLTIIVRSSKTFNEILQHFKLKNIGCNYVTLKRRMNEDGIDYSHIPQGIYAGRGRRNTIKPPLSPSEVLIKDSPYSGKTAKRVILRNKLMECKCDICGLGDIWNGKKIVLILDHKNGVRNDNRIENLHFVCPNCNSQLSTFGGRNIKWPKRSCLNCGGYVCVGSQSGLCRKCVGKGTQIPTRDVLMGLVWELPTTLVAKKFGVSDKAIQRWCNKHKITKPGPGYWSKLRI